MPTGEESARRITHAPKDLERRRRGNQGQYDRSPRWQDHRRPNRNGGPLHPDAGLETSLIVSASHLVHEMIEARDEKRLLRLQDQLARVSLLIVDELGYVPPRRPEASCCSTSSASATRTGHHRHLKPALPRMDNGVRQRAPHGRPTRPHHTPRPHPGNERRELPAQPEPIPTAATVRITPACPRGPTGPTHARDAASRAQGASPRARIPPVEYGDKPPPSP